MQSRGPYRPTFADGPQDGRNAPQPKQQGPSPFDMALNNVANLPLQAFNSSREFFGAGGLSAALGPFMGGNPIANLALKFIGSKLGGPPKIKTEKPMPVSIVEVKDTAMDMFTLGNSRIAFNDTFSRRSTMARPLLRPGGG